MIRAVEERAARQVSAREVLELERPPPARRLRCRLAVAARHGAHLGDGLAMLAVPAVLPEVLARQQSAVVVEARLLPVLAPILLGDGVVRVVEQQSGPLLVDEPKHPLRVDKKVVVVVVEPRACTAARGPAGRVRECVCVGGGQAQTPQTPTHVLRHTASRHWQANERCSAVQVGRVSQHAQRPHRVQRALSRGPRT